MKKDNNKFTYYLPIGISLGVVFGICFDNIGIGICLGVGAQLSGCCPPYGYHFT